MARFRIGIIGAGISGLTTALCIRRSLPPSEAEIVVFEAADGLQEAGAGIQIPPNAARILSRCGVFDSASEASELGALKPSALQVCRYADGSVLSSTPLRLSSELFGAP